MAPQTAHLPCIPFKQPKKSYPTITYLACDPFPQRSPKTSSSPPSPAIYSVNPPSLPLLSPNDSSSKKKKNRISQRFVVLWWIFFVVGGVREGCWQKTIGSARKFLKLLRARGDSSSASNSGGSTSNSGGSAFSDWDCSVQQHPTSTCSFAHPAIESNRLEL